ncbi:MAG: MGMT family protein [Patescibacteria group bacterium]|nr:MGMT family protein [Patescibacteria group bacterium]
MNGFKEKVLQLVSKIPKGRVASYGQIAAALGNPRAARQVGWVLRGLGPKDKPVPWWRVVNQKGELSIKGNPVATKIQQRALLEKDGLEMGTGFVLDMEKYRWQIL